MIDIYEPVSSDREEAHIQAVCTGMMPIAVVAKPRNRPWRRPFFAYNSRTAPQTVVLCKEYGCTASDEYDAAPDGETVDAAVEVDARTVGDGVVGTGEEGAGETERRGVRCTCKCVFT